MSEVLDTALDAPTALVIEGEPGIGKTTLWLWACEEARGREFRVLSARAAAAESVLAYTALADLMRAVDEDVWADLPAPQRHGLDAALLRCQGDVPDADSRAVAAGFLAVINRMAARSPVLVAIDDLQWLDASSANVVAFAARRLPAGAALLCTTRSEASWLQLPTPDAVRRVKVQPLKIGELHKVLTVRLGHQVPRSALLRIHEICGGNAFYALELARELGTSEGNTELGMSSGLGELVRTRIGRLGDQVEGVLLAIASLPDPTLQLVAEAVDTTPDRVVQLLEKAEAQEVVAITGNRVRFTHPLLAHGVYSAAAPRRRRAMHRRLAELLTEPEVRARHLALSATTADPDTLQALDMAAKKARMRGAPLAAAELLELALGLGADTPKRRIRLARHQLDAGNPARARALLEETIETLNRGTLRAEALSTLAVVGLYGDSFLEATDFLERALGEVGDHMPLRVQILVSLSFTLLNTGHLAAALAVGEDAVTYAKQLGYPPLLSQALSLLVHLRFRNGEGLDEVSLEHAMQLEDRDAQMPAALRPSVQKALLLGWSGQFDTAYEQLVRLGQRCTERGEDNELIHVAFNTFQIETWRGNFPNATVIAEDAIERAMQLDSELANGTAFTMRATLMAYAGREAEARADAAAALAASGGCGARLLGLWPLTALVFLEVSLGNYESAVGILQPLLSSLDQNPDAAEISVASFVPDAVEALIALGRLADAEPLVERLERNGRRLSRPWMLAVGARCRAMLFAAHGDSGAATAAAELAMTEQENLDMPFERARTLMLWGQLMRRQRRRDAAAVSLSEALAEFERLGTPLWANRVRTELARGVSGGRRGQGLTPSQHRVAELVAKGMSNRDIAAALFISPKTVEVNITHIYRKLGVHSRIELHRKFASPEGFDPPK